MLIGSAPCRVLQRTHTNDVRQSIVATASILDDEKAMMQPPIPPGQPHMRTERAVINGRLSYKRHDLDRCM
jgi:hypothetical protein